MSPKHIKRDLQFIRTLSKSPSIRCYCISARISRLAQWTILQELYWIQSSSLATTSKDQLGQQLQFYFFTSLTFDLSLQSSVFVSFPVQQTSIHFRSTKKTKHREVKHFSASSCTVLYLNSCRRFSIQSVRQEPSWNSPDYNSVIASLHHIATDSFFLSRRSGFRSRCTTAKSSQKDNALVYSQRSLLQHPKIILFNDHKRIRHHHHHQFIVEALGYISRGRNLFIDLFVVSNYVSWYVCLSVPLLPFLNPLSICDRDIKTVNICNPTQFERMRTTRKKRTSSVQAFFGLGLSKLWRNSASIPQSASSFAN